MLGEDLLDHDPAPREKPREPLEVLPRIGEAVGMVDAHAVDPAAPREPRSERMRGREHVRVLGPQAGEVGDLEEAPVVDLVGGDAPVRER